MLNINKADLKQGQQQYFVFEKFNSENPAQKYVQSSSAIVYGLPILIKLVEQNEVVEIKDTSNAVFNTSFNGMVVCASNIATSEKKVLKDLVELMNGSFEHDLTEDTTHLITNCTKSLKYETAVVRGIQIYHADWIKRVYRETTKEENCWFLQADSEKFQSFILPPFCGLKITTTDVPILERNEIKDNVEGHGGSFEEKFSSNIDILIIGNNVTYNAKYQSAQELKIPCLNTQWISDSIQANYALSFKSYFIKPKRRKQEPNQEETSLLMAESEMEDKMSQDLQAKAKITQSISQIMIETKVKKEPLDISSYLKKDLSQEMIKKSGSLFDGLTFFIHCFIFEDYNKLKKLLTACGAWCTELDENVTHVIFNAVDEESHKLKELYLQMKNNGLHSSVIKLGWVIDSIREQKLMPMRKEYIFEDSQRSSSSFSTLLNQENDKNPAFQMERKRLKIIKPLETSKFPNQKPATPVQKRKLQSQNPVSPKRINCKLN